MPKMMPSSRSDFEIVCASRIPKTWDYLRQVTRVGDLNKYKGIQFGTANLHKKMQEQFAFMNGVTVIQTL